MTSTSTSRKPRDEPPIVRLHEVNLVFKADVHRAWTWRDAAVKIVQDPWSLLVNEKDRLHVARDISFQIKRGERIGLIGVNGAGKTSLCRCIAGMLRPTRGRIEKNGKIRAVFDVGVGIQGELTGRENAELLVQFMYPGDPDPGLLVKEALEFSELGKFVDVPYRLYSNGMQTRLCLSLVTARPGDLLILDEVFDGADAYFKEKAALRMMALIERSGAVLFVSHAEDQIRRACNRTLVLHGGRIAFDGPVKEGLEFYASILPQNTTASEA